MGYAPARWTSHARRWTLGILAGLLACGDSTSPPAVATVAITPHSVTIIVGTAVTLSAAARDSKGNVLTDKTATWSTPSAGIVSLTGPGIVSALAPGNALIIATVGTKADTATVTVMPIPVASVRILPENTILSVGGSTTLGAQTFDAGNHELSGRTVTWTSANPSIVNVTGIGTVTAMAVGQATITATSEGVSATTVVTARAAVAFVEIQPTSVAVAPGGSAFLQATPQDGAHAPLTGRTVLWATANSNVATVSQVGTVTGVSLGVTTVSATSEGITSTAQVVVHAVADYAIVAAQFNQAAQASDGSIPIVLGGNGAVVNVRIQAAEATTTQMQVVLRLFNSAGTLVRADTVVATGLGPTTSYASPNAQFVLPPSALLPGMRWQVVRDPKGVVPDGDPSNDVFPSQTPALVSTVTVPTLKVRFVPVVLTANNNTTGTVSTGNLPNYLRMLESVHPLGAIEATVGAPFPTNTSFGTPPSGGNSGLFWNPLLLQLDLLRLADPDPSTYVMGVVLPPAGFSSITSGGIGYVPFSSGSGPNTRTTATTADGWASLQSYARDLVAHELGHNFGRFHAPTGPPSCDVPAGPDPAYPYTGGLIGLPGYDVRGWMAGRSATPLLMAAGLGDIMGYCNNNWISDYTYRAVLNFRGSTAAALTADARIKSIARTRTLVVRGATNPNGTITLEPAVTVDMRPALPERTGSYRLEGRAADGRVLFAYDFEPTEVDHVPGLRHFTFAIPVTALTEAALASIEVRGAGSSARLEQAPPTAALLAGPTRVAALRAGGMVTVSCANPSARGIVVLNATTGALLGTSRGATASVFANSGSPMTVSCSDGLHSSRSDVVAP